MTGLKNRDQLVDLQILDNEASTEYKKTMTDVWKVEYQLVPPNLHAAMQSNAPFVISRPIS